MPWSSKYWAPSEGVGPNRDWTPPFGVAWVWPFAAACTSGGSHHLRSRLMKRSTSTTLKL